MEKHLQDSLEVRAAKNEDAPTLVRFNQALAEESEGRTLETAVVEAGVKRALSSPHLCRYFVACQDSTVIGQAMVTSELSDWRNGIFWWFQSVYVESKHRRRGVFKALYRHVEDQARRDADVCGLRLYVHRTNQNAIETYRRLGLDVSEYIVCEADWVLKT